MTVMDPSGIQIAASVRTTRGSVFPLWMGGARTSEKPGDADSIFFDTNVEYQDLPIVTAVNIEMTMNYNATCTVEVAAPYELGLALLESELFVIGNVLTVQVGYPRIGLFLPKLSTQTVRPNVSLNPEDGLTATLNGQGGIFAGTRGQSNRQFRNVSVEEVVSTIANLKHNQWSVDFPKVQRRGSLQAGGDPLYAERGSINQDGETDWAFVSRILRASSCRAVIRPVPDGGGQTQVAIRRDSDVARQDPVYTLTARGQVDMVIPNGRFPLLSFESEAEGVWLSAGSDRVRTADIDSRTARDSSAEANQETVADEAPNATTGTVGTGSEEVEGVNVAARAAPEDGGDRHVPLSSNSTERTPAEGVAQGAREEGERGGGMTATVSTIGNPVAFPNDRIRIENIGMFSGNYEIEGMSHQVGEGDWTTTMKLIRRGSVMSEQISEAIRARQDWSASDQAPADQPGIEEDAQGGGETTVTPVDLGEDEFSDLGLVPGL